jgi:hypothetical protein
MPQSDPLALGNLNAPFPGQPAGSPMQGFPAGPAGFGPPGFGANPNDPLGLGGMPTHGGLGGTLPSQQHAQGGSGDNNLPLILGAVGLGSVLLIGLVVGLVMMGRSNSTPTPVVQNSQSPAPTTTGTQSSGTPAPFAHTAASVPVAFTPPIELPSEGAVQRLADGEFEIWMPVAATETTGPAPPGLPPPKVIMALSPLVGAYVVGVEKRAIAPSDNEYGLIERDFIAGASKNLAAQNGKMEVKSSKNTTIHGMPGREVIVATTIQPPNLAPITIEGKLRLVFTGKVLILMTAVPMPGSNGINEKVFFDSFRRVNPNGPNLQIAPPKVAANTTATGTPSTTNVANAAGVAPIELPNEGYVYRFADSKFEIWMPVQPTETTVPQAPGQPAAKVSAAMSPKYGFFVVGVEPSTKMPTDQEIEQTIIVGATRSLAALNGKVEVKSSTKMEIQGMQGREIAVAVTTKQGNATVTVDAKIRLVFTGDLLITMQAVITSNASANLESIFYNSFRRVDPNGPNLKIGSTSIASLPTPAGSPSPGGSSGSSRPGSSSSSSNIGGQVVRSSDNTVSVNLPSVPPGDAEKKTAMGTECLLRDLKGDPNGRFAFAEYTLPLGKTTRDLVLSLVDEPIPGVKSPGAVRKRDISLEGRPSFELDFDQGNEFHKAKIIGYGSKVYVLYFAGPKDKAKEKPVTDFLRSFRVGS